MSMAGDRVLQALVRSAVEATAAADGWLMAVDDAALRVVAAWGARPSDLLDLHVPIGSGIEGYVAGSGQPMALAPRDDDPRLTEGVLGARGRRTTSLLSVPCDDESGVVGVLTLVDKAGGGTFSFDDVEVASLLATVAGPAIAQRADGPAAPAPVELSAQLQRLADADPERYALVADILTTLLARG